MIVEALILFIVPVPRYNCLFHVTKWDVKRSKNLGCHFCEVHKKHLTLGIEGPFSQKTCLAIFSWRFVGQILFFWLFVPFWDVFRSKMTSLKGTIKDWILHFGTLINLKIIFKRVHLLLYLRFYDRNHYLFPPRMF